MGSRETWALGSHSFSAPRDQVSDHPRIPLPSSPGLQSTQMETCRAHACSDPASRAPSAPTAKTQQPARGWKGRGSPAVSPGAEALAHVSWWRRATRRRSAKRENRGCCVPAAATPTPSGLGSLRGSGGSGRRWVPLCGTRTTSTSGVWSAPPHVAAAVVPPTRGCAVVRPRPRRPVTPPTGKGGLGATRSFWERGPR